MHRSPLRRLTTVSLALALVAAVGVPGALAGEKHPSVAPPSYDEVRKGGAEAILKATDEIHFSYDTQEVEALLEVHESDGSLGRTIRMKMYQDGDKRLIRILEPPEVKGMGILIKDADTMYVYVPEFDKVRLVAAHARKQTFLGSDFSYDDMGMAALSKDYVPTIEKETDDTVVLSLKAKPDRSPAFPKLRVYIDKKTLQMKKQEYFDEDGRLVRTQERSDMRTWKSEDYAVQSRIKMTDHTNHDHWTELKMQSFEANHDLPSRLFSKRTLVRGE